MSQKSQITETEDLQKLEEFNDMLEPVRQSMESAREAVFFNFDRIVKQVTHLEEIESKTEQLTEQSEKFKTRASNLRRRHWWEKYKLPVIISSTLTAGGVATWLLLL